MKNNFKAGVFIFILYLMLFLPELNADSESLFPAAEPAISMDFQDANLKDILKIFSIQSGLNFIASEAVRDRKMTLYLDKVPLERAMDKLFKANNLSYELDKEANIFVVKDWGIPQIETVTKVFYLKYATVSSSSLKEEMANYIKSETAGGETAGGETAAGGDTSGTSSGGSSGKWKIEEDAGITTVVKKLLSQYGSVIEDFRTNSLIVIDIPSRMETIAQAIAALDVRVPQVMLEVEMLDVSKNAVDKIGLKFGSSTSPSIMSMVLTGAKRYMMFPFSPWAGGDYTTDRTGTNKAGNMVSGNIDFSSTAYSVLLDFFSSQTDTKYLARPRILTLNNETAEIKITTQETVGRQITSSGEGTTAETTTGVAERAETGVSLRVTPQINTEAGEITMFIMPVVKDTSTSSFATSESGSTYFKDPEERSTKSMVRIKDGDTVIIGGLLRNELSQTNTKLPILGNIPVLGGLFRHKNKEKDKERELLVFITPHIIKDNPVELVQAKKVVFPEREQNTASGANRELTIHSSLNNFEKQR